MVALTGVSDTFSSTVHSASMQICLGRGPSALPCLLEETFCLFAGLLYASYSRSRVESLGGKVELVCFHRQ